VRILNASRIKNRQFPTEALFVGILASLFFLLAFLYLREVKTHFDYMYILKPVFNPDYEKEYGDFTYFFYSFVINIGKLFGPIADKIQTARLANCLLYGLNSIVFFHLLRFYFSKWWSILGIFLFSLSPGVFFSAVEIKTESLLLFEFLILANSLELFLNCSKKKRFLFAGISGFISSLGFSTKFFPLFPVLFFSSVYFQIKNNKFKFFSKDALFIFLAYFIFLLLGIYITFPNILEQLQGISEGKFSQDLLFTTGPNWFKSIDEFVSFPFGRYSYPFLTIMPLSLGLFNFIGAIISLFWRKVEKKSVYVYFPFLIIFFLFTCHLTLLRMPWMFTLASPIIILFSLYFWREVFFIFRKGKKQILNVSIIIFLFIYSLFDYRSFSDYIFSYMNTFLTTSFQIKKELSIPSGKNGPLEIFANVGNVSKFHNSWHKIIQEKKPQYISLYGGFIENYCKYRFDKTYIEMCNYFKNLLDEKEEYRIIWKISLEYPYRPWIFDPELYSYFYYLRRV
jgi:hypothetical protein